MTIKTTFAPILLLVTTLLFLAASASTSDDSLPPIRTQVNYIEDKEQKNDDPNKAWEEWGETEHTRKNPFPRRQRKIQVGMDIHTIMGMAMKQPKVLSAVLSEQFASNEKVAHMVTNKFRNQLAAAGIGCRLWFVPNGRQVIANCESIRDAHMAKDYMVSQPQIIRTVLDNVPFTPRPAPNHDDDDDDDDDEQNEEKGTGKVDSIEEKSEL